MGETLLDVKGLNCPLPVLRANRTLRTMQPGEKLRVLATDRAAVADFRAYCRETGHHLLAFAEEAGVFSFTIRRRPDRPEPPDTDAPPPASQNAASQNAAIEPGATPSSGPRTLEKSAAAPNTDTSAAP